MQWLCCCTRLIFLRKIGSGVQFFWNSWLTRDSVTEQPSFKDGRSLFNVSMAKGCNSLRDMEDSYGILPIPKYDEYQEQHASLVWMHHDCVLGIPASCSNKEAISVVLEHMSYISYYDVYPIFYDTIILGKSARDQQSKEMLELVFQTRSFDAGQYWLGDQLPFLVLVEQHKTNIASTWAGSVKAVEAALENFNEKIDECRAASRNGSARIHKFFRKGRKSSRFLHGIEEE
mgnify:CR=1 FL=1